MKRLCLLFLIMLALCPALTGCGAKAKVTEQATEKAAEAKAPGGEVETLVEEVATKVVLPTPTSASEEEEEPAPPQEEPTATTVPPTVEPTAYPTSTPVVEEPELATEPPGVARLVANPEEVLDSYRRRTIMRFREEGGSWGPDAKMETEWVRDPLARRVVMYDESGSVSLETITLGDTTYAKMGNTWLKSEAQETVEEEGPQAEWDWDSLMQDMQKAMQSGMTLVGEETVNEVRCKHYAIDAHITIPFPVPEDMSEEELEMFPKEVTSHERGDVWVADQPDLPPVIIRSVTEGEMTFKSSSGDRTQVMQNETNVYDVNGPITIEPPSDEEIGAEASECPMMPDAQVTMASSGMTTYATASPVKDVVAFYEAEMAGAGWTQEGETMQMAGMAMMHFTKEGRAASATIMPAEEGSGSQVMLVME